MSQKCHDRSAEDIGNIISLEHLNLTVPDHDLASLFYITGLGLTRDPYMDFGIFRNIWVNIGEQQFHLPKSDPQRFRGSIGLVLPDLDALEKRLSEVGRALSGTLYSWDIKDHWIEVTGPWGNQFICHGPEFASDREDYRYPAKPGPGLGLVYLETRVPVGTAAGIARFYTDVFRAPAELLESDNLTAAIRMGGYQTLRFREVEAAEDDYDKHHIAIYLANFSGPYEWLVDKGLITEESDRHQYRFQTLIDPKSGQALYELEHEVRSLQHPLYNRNLVNRNASQDFFSFRKSREAFVPEL